MRRIRLTLKELRGLGLAWPPGPVEPPADDDAPFDLASEAMGCASLYHDTKGDTRYRDQGSCFEALAAQVLARVPRDPAEVRAEALRAVLARPDDDAPRLAYADALGEGDGHAQFIRLQCEAAGLPRWSARRRTLLTRAHELREAHWDTWGSTRDPLADYRDPYEGPRLSFRRGFVEGLALDASTLDHLALLREHPIRELRVDGDAAPLATADLANVRRLVVNGGPVAEALAVATARGTWRGVEDFTLLAGVVGVAGAHLADARRVVASVARGEAFPRLRALALPDTPLDASTLAALTTSERAYTLASLAVRAHDDAAVGALAAPLPALERLVVVGEPYDLCPRPRAAPLAGLDAARLRELELRGVALGDGGGDALAAAPWLQALVSLTLSRLDRCAGALPLLARLGPSLRELALGCDDYAGAGEALGRSGAGRALARLDVHETIAAPDLDALLDAAPALETFASAHAPPKDPGVLPLLARRGFVAQGTGTWARGG